MPNRVEQVPAGWWRASNVPLAQFRTKAMAARASRTTVAKAWTLEFHEGTLAKGDSFMEQVIRFKQANNLPYTPAEKRWIDTRVATRARRGGKKRHGRDLGPPWRMPGERILGEVTPGGSPHRRATPRMWYPEGHLPAHLVEPTKTLAEMELDAQAEAVRKLLRK